MSYNAHRALQAEVVFIVVPALDVAAASSGPWFLSFVCTRTIARPLAGDTVISIYVLVEKSVFITSTVMSYPKGVS